MVGILVHGNNHFILSGPSPDEAAALALLRHWPIVQIGEAKSSSFGQWQIRSKEFRENLEWAVIVPGDRDYLSRSGAITRRTFSSRGNYPEIEQRLLVGRARRHSYHKRGSRKLPDWYREVGESLPMSYDRRLPSFRIQGPGKRPYPESGF